MKTYRFSPACLRGRARWLLCLVFTLLAVGFAGCAPSNETAEVGVSSEEADNESGTTSESPPLIGTRWLLASFPGGPVSIPTDPFPYLIVGEDFLNIETGCNNVDVNHHVDAERFTIEMSMMRGINCEDLVSPEALALEDAFLSTVRTWSTYRIEGNELFIQYSGGELRFNSLIPTDPLLLRAFPFYDVEQQEQSEETQSIHGMLTLVDGCLRIVPADREDEHGYLIIWRDDLAIGLEEGTLAIYDTFGREVGDRVAVVGDEISLTGSAIEQTEPLVDGSFGLQVPTPTQCPGPYWILEQITSATSALSTSPSR